MNSIVSNMVSNATWIGVVGGIWLIVVFATAAALAASEHRLRPPEDEK